MPHPLDKFRHCPICGSENFHKHDEKSKQCADCRFIYYFNPSAATVAFILNAKDELLVCRRGKEPAKGTLDLPGGFIDMYETAEEGIAREVKEETGLDLLNSRYLFSLPNTYLYSDFLVHTLDLFFLCETKPSNQLAANDDVAETFWLPIHSLNPEDFGLTSIREGIKRFLENRSLRNE